MCDPTMMAMGKVGVAAFAEGERVREQNEAHAKNSMAARTAATNENMSTTQRYVQDQRSLIQAGMDSVLEGRAAEALAYTSAVENGVQGTSVNEVIMEKRALEGRNSNRSQQEIESLRTNTGIDFSNIDTKRQNRENSVPRTKFSMAKIAGAAADAASGLM
jgi:hypothetical protein